MKRPVSTILIAALVVAAGAFFFVQWNNTAPSAITAAASSASLQEYTPEAVASAGEGEKVVLFFHARWCSTCKLLADDITANAADIPDDVQILLVDFDTATELKQQYGVTQQHTLVQVSADGELIGKWSLSRTLDDLLSEIS